MFAKYSREEKGNQKKEASERFNISEQKNKILSVNHAVKEKLRQKSPADEKNEVNSVKLTRWRS